MHKQTYVHLSRSKRVPISKKTEQQKTSVDTGCSCNFENETVPILVGRLKHLVNIEKNYQEIIKKAVLMSEEH
jgi:hypothetical protein